MKSSMSKVESLVRQSLQLGNACQEIEILPTTEKYLSLAERIVRQGANWQDEESGRIIDPFVKMETPTATARFVGALGLQILQGRCLDLEDVCAKALTPVLEDLHSIATTHGEFLVKEACMAYWALKNKVPANLFAYWTKLLSEYDPEKAYARTLYNMKKSIVKNQCVFYPHDLSKLINNFVTFGIAGEAIKNMLKLTDNNAFIDEYLTYQLQKFDSNGMYNDPHSPMTYDVVSRMNLSLALWAGYRGKCYEQIDENLKRGALSQLLCQSPIGELPFGGRSNMQNYNEASTALICEYEARRWQASGDLLMAGCFKRAAVLAINSIEKYLQADPIYFTKNLFPPETQHGRQKGYGYYGAYSLLIASQLGFAALLADNDIKETKCPAECGAYVFATEESFHKVFVSNTGTQLEFDYCADSHYDATGLGRVHFMNFPAELVLSAPITASPGFLTVGSPSARNIAIGPGWFNEYGDVQWLTEFKQYQKPIMIHKFAEDGKSLEFTIKYENLKNCQGIISKYCLKEKELLVEETIIGYADSFFLQIPLLQTNGKVESNIKIENNSFLVEFADFIYKVECLNPGKVTLGFENFEAPNRNGIYKIGIIRVEEQKLIYKISI